MCCVSVLQVDGEDGAGVVDEDQVLMVVSQREFMDMVTSIKQVTHTVRLTPEQNPTSISLSELSVIISNFSLKVDNLLFYSLLLPYMFNSFRNDVYK